MTLGVGNLELNAIQAFQPIMSKTRTEVWTLTFKTGRSQRISATEVSRMMIPATGYVVSGLSPVYTWFQIDNITILY